MSHKINIKETRGKLCITLSAVFVHSTATDSHLQQMDFGTSEVGKMESTDCINMCATKWNEHFHSCWFWVWITVWRVVRQISSAGEPTL